MKPEELADAIAELVGYSDEEAREAEVSGERTENWVIEIPVETARQVAAMIRKRAEALENAEQNPFKVSTPPRPVANPTPDWCEKYADWFEFNFGGEEK